MLMNTQEGWRVPDIRQFALEQPEVRYFEHDGRKTYAEGEDPDAPDSDPQLERQLDGQRLHRQRLDASAARLPALPRRHGR